jgi:nucleoside-diphosphate-sugar epimerase
MKRILITGSSGFIGSSLARRLRENSPAEPPLCPGRAELDLHDGAAVAAYLQRHRPGKIVHLAASIAKGEDAASRASQWRDTFEAGRILLEQAAAAGVQHLLMAGTVAELGDAAGALAADLPAAPRTTYGLCKALLMECARFTTRRAPVRIDWFRPFTVYGPGQTGPMMIPVAFAAAVKGAPADFTDGVQQRDFLYIDDLIDWLELALTVAPAGPGEFHLHHLGSGLGTPVREVLAAIAAEFPGARFNLGAVPRRPEEPLCQVAPLDRCAAGPLARWAPRTAWRDGIAKTAASWRKPAG